MTPDEQKAAFGEKLYALISKIPVNKNSPPQFLAPVVVNEHGDTTLLVNPLGLQLVTGMLLELNGSELLDLMDDGQALKRKVVEALQVLAGNPDFVKERMKKAEEEAKRSASQRGPEGGFRGAAE